MEAQPFAGVVVSVLLLTRYLNFNENSKYVSLILFTTIILGVNIYSYKMEKLERQNFILIKKLKLNQKRIMNLILNGLPSAALIAKDGKIISTNEKAEKMFDKLSFEEILDETKKIKIKSNIPENNQVLSPLLSPRREMFDITNKTELLWTHGQVNECDTLFDIINLRSPSELNKYIGVFRKTDEISDNEDSNYIDISVSKILWNDEDATFLFIHQNEIAQKYNELDRQAKYKDKLLATVSHDLRTPLSGVIGMIRLASESVTDESTKESLSIAERSSLLLLNMINDLLDLSQISNGSLRLNFKTFSVMDLVEEVSHLISFQAKYKGLEFIVEKKESLTNCLLYNDPTRLKQILLNLLGNALKFTEKGFIKISIENSNSSSRPPDSANIQSIFNNEGKSFCNEILLKVEDSGNGIKKEDIPKLFKLFGKLETEENKKLNQTGVGLGLSISQNLVQLLNRNMPGYEIKVSSDVGRGSCFSFCVKSFDDELKENKNIEDASNQGSELIHTVPDFGTFKKNLHLQIKTSNNLRILVVEDDPINIMVVSSYLKFYNDLTFDVSHNGHEAVEMVKRMDHYDIILMDCNMPIMDGFQAARKILKIVSQTNRPPLTIVAMTANVSPLDYEKCFEAGMKEHISKPFTRERLREVILKFKR